MCASCEKFHCWLYTLLTRENPFQELVRSLHVFVQMARAHSIGRFQLVFLSNSFLFPTHSRSLFASVFLSSINFLAFCISCISLPSFPVS